MQGYLFEDEGPLLQRSGPGAEQLADYICNLAEQQDASPAAAWAALMCLQHGTAGEEKVRVLN